MNNITVEELKRRKESRKLIVKTHEKYGRLYTKMLSKHSCLSDKERIILIRKFELSYKIAEIYYMYNDFVEKSDPFFKYLIINLNNLEEIDRKYNRKNRKK